MQQWEREAGGCAGALVAFDVLVGHGVLEPAHAYTDAKGIAAVSFAGGSNAEPSLIRAAAARLPDEPGFFTVRAPVSTRASSTNSEDSPLSGTAPVSGARTP